MTKFKLPPKTNPLRQDINIGYLFGLENEINFRSLRSIQTALEDSTNLFTNNTGIISLTAYARNNDKLVLLRVTRYNNLEILWDFGGLPRELTTETSD